MNIKTLLLRSTPILVVCLAIAQASSFKDTMSNFKYAFGGGTAVVSAQEQNLIDSIKQKQELFREQRAGTDYLSAEYVSKAMKDLVGVSVVSDKDVAMVGGVWTQVDSNPEAKEIVLKTNNLVDTMLLLDKVNLYYDSIEISEVDGIIKLIVRLTEVTL